ncbi:Rpn family recombination-promoting nuclease/putative transposase [Arsenophonus sp.]|uniref:Rpn family recombination-promoting nuclease/putative transposase n=1 Tax=Arsenophonus sp. TaxID=1872640 RepID=UPI002867123F|nr:Rpn family recombination-promoting nuclease/putative transposase [Arsenophonus sp.]MDR5617884.1 Rpn family recombination-promoting nuclease/putative transposase [Arsenophonus sp.]MDR5617899.1 Rpn family recombination-promoting nuclease/putative transposase [Arsenophonus sp.]MDR5617920.1 Rpn family recombination-promoting nuclease/putative transposase [Arsenophonus sp.]MDR5617934.1 Rpn family recombination-promoting nuclease/putative transposase [Arsenophonus sp.]
MSKKFTPTPHDAVFRQFLSEKETAKDFFDIWLPDEIKALCDLDSLKVESGSFIDSDMKNYQSDIIYSVSTTKGSGYIYVLIEHQSTPDKLIAWRLMRYSMAAMQKHLEAGHRQLPLVFPILFYSGEQSPHPYSTNWLDCFEDRKLAESIYTNPFKLADVTTLDDGEIMKHKRMSLLTLIQKHIRRRDMTELMNEIVTLLSYNYYTDNQVITMFNYLIQEGNAQKPMKFITEIAKQSEKHEGALMTIAQALRQEGRKEGIQQGLQRGKLEGRQEGYQLGKNDGVQEGIQKGKLEAQLEIAKQMLITGMDRQSVMKFTGLNDDEMINLFKD